MNISLERLEDCKARVTAELAASETNSIKDSVVSAFASQAKVPGFRPGKIPSKVIKKRYQPQIEEELKERLFRKILREVSEEEKVTILGIVQIDREVFEADGAFSLITEVVLEPDTQVKDKQSYKGIAVEIPKIEITDEVVENSLQSIRKNLAELVEVDRAAAIGDILTFDYEGEIDDAARELLEERDLNTLIEAEGFVIELLEKEEEIQEPVPGISGALSGLKAGESKEVEIQYPGEFEIAELAGKSIIYHVTLTCVQEPSIPEADDELAQKVGAENLADLRNKIRQKNEEEREDLRFRMIQNQILQHLNQELEFDLPQHVLFNETQNQVNQMVYRGYQQGLQEDDIEKNQEEIVSNAEQRARQNVKTNFILNQIAEAENIAVDDEELSRDLAIAAMRQGTPFKKYIRELRKNNGIEEARENLLLSKTLEFLVSSATVTEVDPPEADKADS